MVNPNVSAALQRFVDDELMRSPLLVDQVIEAALDHMRKGMAGMMPHDRAVASDLLQSVLANRQHVLDYYMKSLSDQVLAELGRKGPNSAAPAPRARELSLVDEDEVAVDVEISHTIEAIRSVAEYELRELQTFVSALVGDMDVARDHNPFRAEAHARALWNSAQALPLSRGYQITYMRHASMPLAQVLRKTFAGASSRLEAAGIEPASHRTLILPAGSRRQRPESTFNPDLYRIRDSMPVRELPPAPAPALEQVLQQTDAQWRSLPAETNAGERERLRERLHDQLVESAASKADQQVIELVTRLFDAILADRELAADIQLLLARLQAPALRMALRDPNTLDKDNHPLWQFMDQIAFIGDTLPEAGEAGDAARAQALRGVQSVIDHVVAEPEQTRQLYAWAVDRLLSQAQHRFGQRCAAASHEIESLQPLEDRLTASQAPPSTLHGALDLAQLDTVPAELIDQEPARKKPAATAQHWLDQRRSSHWVRMFMQGRWVKAQLLWPGERGELFLFGDGASDTTWAVRRRALLTLHGENLLNSLEPRSLVRDAAKNVMRRLARPT
jgi:hypothetical protein